MENQHQKIKGYRDLSQAEIDLMNEIKAHNEATEKLCDKVRSHLRTQAAKAEGVVGEQQRIAEAEPVRWLAMARTDLQVAAMKLVRAVAQPTTF